jgi:hypothetical protein
MRTKMRLKLLAAGRPTAISPAGFESPKARPPATHSQPCPSRSVSNLHQPARRYPGTIQPATRDQQGVDHATRKHLSAFVHRERIVRPAQTAYPAQRVTFQMKKLQIRKSQVFPTQIKARMVSRQPQRASDWAAIQARGVLPKRQSKANSLVMRRKNSHRDDGRFVAVPKWTTTFRMLSGC